MVQSQSSPTFLKLNQVADTVIKRNLMSKPYRIISSSHHVCAAVPFAAGNDSSSDFVVKNTVATYYPKDIIIFPIDDAPENIEIAKNSKGARSLRTNIYTVLDGAMQPKLNNGNEPFAQGSILKKDDELFFVVSNQDFAKKEHAIFVLSASMGKPKLPLYREVVCSEELWYLNCLLAHKYKYPLNEYNPKMVQPIVDCTSLKSYQLEDFSGCAQSNPLTSEDFAKFYHVNSIFLKDLLKTKWKN